MGPGWFCDGCGDYRAHDGKESYSVNQRELRAENQRMRKFIQRVASGEHADELPEEASALLSNNEGVEKTR